MEKETFPILIIGCGPGSPDYLTQAAIGSIKSAQVIVGAKRLLDLFPNAEAERLVLGPKMDLVLDQIDLRRKDGMRIAVAVTGDPGLFSLTQLVVNRFGRKACRVIAGVSSVQAAFAAIGLDWADARIISAHKENPDICPELVSADKIAVLGGRDGFLQWVAENLLLSDEKRIFLCEDITLETESIREIPVQELARQTAGKRSIALIIKGSLIE